MLEQLHSTIVQLIAALVVAVLTAWVTVRLSLRRFRTERWWELKAEAYSRIIEALYHIKVYSDAKIPEYEEGVQYGDEYKKQLSDECSNAHRELNKVTAIGAYIICEEAANVLDDLRKRPELDWDKNPPLDIFKGDAKAYGEALQKVREIAMRDLGVPVVDRSRGKLLSWFSFR